MTSSKAAPVSDGQNVEQGHMAYDVKKSDEKLHCEY